VTVSRALSAEENNRYPWASRINDYVPVGRLRHAALTASGIGLLVLTIGAGVLFLQATNVREGIGLTTTLFGQITLVVSGVLIGFGFVFGIITAITALVHNAMTPLVWSVAALTPGLVALFIVASRTL
jgi:hypothetical protein